MFNIYFCLCDGDCPDGRQEYLRRGRRSARQLQGGLFVLRCAGHGTGPLLRRRCHEPAACLCGDGAFGTRVSRPLHRTVVHGGYRGEAGALCDGAEAVPDHLCIRHAAGRQHAGNHRGSV